MRNLFQRIAILVAALILAAACALSSGQSPGSDDEAFLAGLRQRRLFELAERHCRQRLADQNLAPAARADMTIELIRTLAGGAIHAPPAEREQRWKQARETAAEFIRTHATHPRLVLVRVQDALTLLARGEMARQERDAGAESAAALGESHAALRDSVKLLEAIDADLNREIPLRRRTTPKEGELSADELFSLQHHVRHQLARGYRNQGLLYEPDSADRISALSQAKEALSDAIVQATEDPELSQRMRLDLAICRRLLEDFGEARRELTELDQEGIAPPVRLAARAELVRVALERQQLDEGKMLVQQGRTLAGAESPEFDLATLEMCLAQWKARSDAKDTAGAETWQKLTAEQARLLEERHGLYWGRRADQLLVRSLPQGVPANAELLERTADSLYLKGDFDQALAAYDQAAEQARKSTTSAFGPAYKAALLQEKRQQHRDAANRFCSLATTQPEKAEAAEAHFRGIWNAAQEVRRDESYAGQYEKLLAQQIETWPAAEASMEARMWLGRWLERRQQWQEATIVYAGVLSESKQYPAAVNAAIACYQRQLAVLAEEGKPVDDVARRAVDYLRRVVLGPENAFPEKWVEPQRAAALGAAEILLDYRTQEAATAEEFLNKAIAGSGDAPAEWTAAAKTQLVLALLLQPQRRKEAEQMLTEIGQASPAQLLDLLSGLMTASARMRPERRRDLADFQLAIASLLERQRQQLDAGAKLSLDRVTADALAAAGRRGEAVEIYARLAKENPSHGGIQEAYGDLLLDAADKELLGRALAQWRVIAARSKPRSERWFKAKYSVALSQSKLGDKAGAATLLRYVLQTPPGLEGTLWQARYEALLQACQ